MMRRGVYIIGILVIILFVGIISVYAQVIDNSSRGSNLREETQGNNSVDENEVKDVGDNSEIADEDKGDNVGEDKAEDKEKSEEEKEEIEGDDEENSEEEELNEVKKEDSGEIEDVSDDDVEKELDAGITPDSIFYFIDKLFDGLQNCIDNRGEKAAEIKVMIEAGKIEEAKVALKKYNECAEKVEKEVNPEEKEKIERSSKIIRKAIKNIEDKIPESDREDFEDIIGKEERIENAAKIASKIKNLCEELSKLDPLEYSKVCKIDDKVPEWRKVHDKKLTEEQKKEAKEFGGIMRECMRTSGVECRCEDIDFAPMSKMCTTARPLAVKCEEGDESSCEELNSLEFPEMPDYLLEVMDDVERNVKIDQFDKHMPKECIEEGADTSQKCIELMFRRNAPGPCLNALDRGEISFKNEREAREACEKIMFEDNAPKECVEAGLRNPRECGKLMFQKNAPEECIEAGLTGEHKDDPRKCEKIMRGKGEGFGPPDHAVAAGFRCKDIENSDERLKCFDEALKSVEGRGKDYYDYSNEQRGPPGGWPEPCEKAGAKTRESCEKIMRERGEKMGEEDRRKDYEQYYKRDYDQKYKETMERERACVEQCSKEGKSWDFSNGECKCRKGERRDYEQFKQGGDQFKQRQEYERSFIEDCSKQGGRWDCSGDKCNCIVEQRPLPTPTEPTTTPTTPTTPQEQPTTSPTTPTEQTTSPTPLQESGGGGDTSGVTGGIILDNDFLDYFYR